MRNALTSLRVRILCAGLVALLGGQNADFSYGQLADRQLEGESSREAKADAIRSVPFNRLNAATSDLIREVVERPSFFRRMPSQQIECDPQMFTFLVRRPEVMVNIWELMGITQVSTKRTTPYSFLADDGAGTTAKCDLVYGDENLHIYYGNGIYDGSMTPRKMRGRCVCILQSRDAKQPDGQTHVAGTMDVFLKLDNLGADLVTRTLGPFVGKTADYNFVETAKFISQISQVCTHNPAAAQGLALQLNRVDESVRQEFAAIAAKIAASAPERQSLVEHEQAESVAFEPNELEAPKFVSRDGFPAREIVETRLSDPLETNRTSEPFLPTLRPPMAVRPNKSNIFMRR
ncbi:MAG: hypothetical protein R3C53_04540 [Pirellulaceae bacterium]